MLFLLLGLGMTLALTQILGGGEGEEEETVEDNGFERVDEGVYEGGDGDDRLLFSDLDDEDPLNLESVSGGAGNDLIDLVHEGKELSFYGTAEYGSVDDIDPRGILNVSLGDGDDTLRSFVWESVDAGPGDDLLELGQYSSNGVLVYGGDGDDTIDALNMENETIYGGAGDDEISITGPSYGGAGYVAVAYGGEGDDHLTVVTDTKFNDKGLFADGHPPVLEGGAGADMFTVQIVPGLQESELDPNFFDGDRPVDVDSTTAAWVRHFEPGIDKLILDVEAQAGAITLDHIRMEEVGEGWFAGQTAITLRYDVADGIDREQVIYVKATGLTWDDITLEGATRDVLVPLAA